MTFTYVLSYFLVDLAAIAIGLVIFSHLRNDMGSEAEMIIFRLFIISIIVFCATNSIWIWINNGYLKMSGMFNSIINIIVLCLCAFFWFLYIQTKTNPKRIEEGLFRFFIVTPLALAIITIVSTPFTKLIFYYENGQFTHGPLYAVMAALAMFYLFIATIQLVFYRSKTETKSIKKEYDILMLFLMYPLVGGIIDVIMPDLPVMELCMIAGVITIFTGLQGSRIYNDSLTGIGNRRRAEEFLQEIVEYLNDDDSLYFFVVDVDELKTINDKYGHFEGDKALKLVADSLKRAVGNTQTVVARWGGDEFVIIAMQSNIGSPDELIQKIDDNLRIREESNKLRYSLHVSVGYTRVASKYAAMSDLVKRADQMMYQVKLYNREHTMTLEKVKDN